MALLVTGLMLLGGTATLLDHASPAVGAASSRGPEEPATPGPSEPPTSPASSDAGATGACGTGDHGGPPSATANEPGVSQPALLYNSQVEPYAVLTGPYGYVAGGAALRDLGSGEINLTWPGDSTENLVAAYLIWSIMDNSLPPANVTLNGVNVTGTWAAYATPSPCWSPTFIYAFVADVTNDVANGWNYLRGVPSGITSGENPWGAPETYPMDEGATLIAVYSTDSSSVQQVTVYTGAQTDSGGGSLSAQLSYSPAIATDATTTFVVEDGQLPGNAAVWNGSVVDSNAFPGRDPKNTSTAWSYGNLSDTLTFTNVTVPVGSDSITASMYPTEGDCFTWVGQVLSVTVAPTPPPYTVEFLEQGLNNGTEWNVTTNGTTSSGTVVDASSTIDFSLQNGTYGYSIPTVPGYTVLSPGSYQVNGGPVFIRVLFHQVVYPVTFSETGLPSESSWWVVVTNSSQGLDENLSSYPGETSTVDLGNGTYTYTAGTSSVYKAKPPTSTFTLAGEGATVVVTYVPPPLFNVTFVAHGLVAGTTWGGGIDTNFGYFYPTTTAASFTEQLPNASGGTDSFSPDSVAGYASPPSFFFDVDGANETLDVNYSELYVVTFTESGLPTGTEWTLYVTGGSTDLDLYSFGSSLLASVPNGSYTYTVGTVWGYTAEPETGPIVVDGANLSVQLTFVANPTYWLNVTETGLAPGTSWSVTLYLPNDDRVSGTSTTPTISFSEPNGSFELYVTAVPGYVASPTYAYPEIEGADVDVPIAFTPVFDVSFTESGLPTGSYWEVLVGSSYLYAASTSLGLNETNGSYSYTVYESDGFSPTPSSGTIVVDGENVSVTVVYSEAGHPTYNVEFTETGLPAGSEWSVELYYDTLSTTGPSLNFTEENGSLSFYVYGPYGYTATPESGSVDVDGAPVVQPIAFAGAGGPFEVTFTETGLPTGTEWFVNLTGGSSYSSTTDAVAFELGNGVYDYVIGTPDTNFAAAPGEFTVEGAAVSVGVTFTLETYSVVFTETGLPTGTEWSVTLNGDTETSTTSTIEFQESNETYDFTVGAVTGYNAAPSSGSVSVVGGGSQGIVFASTAATPFEVTFTETGLPSGTTWWVNITAGASLESTTASSDAELENGPYDFTVGTTDKSLSSPAGSFTVDGGTVAVTVPFTPVTFGVTFTERGLPAGTTWWVNVTGGASLDSSAAAIVHGMENGSYTFSVASLNKSYEGSGTSFKVSGQPVAVTVAFSLLTFAVTFTETGLPAGTTWWVNVTGESPLSSTATTVTADLPNGTYAFTAVSDDRAYSADVSPARVHGEALSVTVAFSASSSGQSTAGSPFLGLPGNDGYYALGIAAGFVAFLLLLLFAARRRKKKAAPPPGQATAPPSGGSAPPAGAQ